MHIRWIPQVCFCIISFRVIHLCTLHSIWEQISLYIYIYISYFMLFIIIMHFLLYTILFSNRDSTWFVFKELNPSAIVHRWDLTLLLLLSFCCHLVRNVTHHSRLPFPWSNMHCDETLCSQSVAQFLDLAFWQKFYICQVTHRTMELRRQRSLESRS